MESYDATAPTDITQSIPQGLIEHTGFNTSEKNVGESQMAEFSTPLDEVVPQGAGMQMQDMAFGSAMAGPPMQQQQQARTEATGRKIPFGLTSEQYMAALAGIAAVVATSKPIQERVAQMFPNIDAGSASAMAMTALLAALIFFLAHRFLN
jgi:hypothetical protein